MTATLRAPFPWFGGKRRAAPLVWAALGDPAGYVEPFAGSAAVLLARPPFRGRRTETINDLDGWLVNAWRAIQLSPAEVARHAWGPVTEIDYHARLAWLQDRRTDGLVSWLEGDPEAHDAKAAAWWLYVCAAGIGNPFDPGPWRVVDGRLVDTREPSSGIRRELPHLGNAGRGINRGHDTPLAAYLGALADRLKNVRITCGHWNRVLTPVAFRAGTGGDGSRAAFIDPPYTVGADLYTAKAGGDVQPEAAEWCLQAGRDGARIVVAGYNGEHPTLEADGWTCIQGRATGGGYRRENHNGARERLWLSPGCIQPAQQTGLWDGEEAG